MACRLMDMDEGRTNFWSGRWESNPSPYTANLLNPFIASTRLGSIRVHNRGYFFDRCAMRIPYDMPVNLQRRPRIGVTKLTLYDFWCSPRVEQERGMGVTKCVDATSVDLERVKNRPEVIFHDFVGGGWSVISGNKKKALRVRFPLCPISLENIE